MPSEALKAYIASKSSGLISTVSRIFKILTLYNKSFYIYLNYKTN